MHFAVAGDARLAEELGADLHDLARHAGRRRRRAQDAARIAEPGDAGVVQQVRIDARDLRRDVGAHAEQAPGERIDDLERLQVEVAPACRSAANRDARPAAAARAGSRARASGRAACGAALRSRSASAGSTSSMYSGRSHLRMAHEPEAGERRARSTISPTKRIWPSDSSMSLAKRLAPERAARRTAGRLRGSARARAPPRANPALRAPRARLRGGRRRAFGARAALIAGSTGRTRSSGRAPSCRCCCGTSPCTPRGCGRTRRTRDWRRTPSA